MTFSTTIATAAALLGCIASPLSAQRRSDAGEWTLSCRNDDRSGRWGDDDRARFCEIRETGFKAPGRRLTVDPGDNGAIRITGWDRDSVAVAAKVQTQAGTDADARDLAGQVRIEAAGGTIRADGPASRRRASWSVSFELKVPRNTDLEAETVNGPIAVADVKGRMDLHAQNGPLHLDALAGDVHARTVNGPLVITLEGTKWDGNGLDGETQNGPVVLTLPEGYSAHLETGTVNGPMNVDIPITVQGRFNFRRLSTDIGSGGPTVRAVTTNGPVTVQRP